MQARPFLFDQAFDDDDAFVVSTNAAEPEAAEADEEAFDAAALDVARAEGFAAGYAAGENEANARAAAEAAAAEDGLLASIAGCLEGAISGAEAAEAVAAAVASQAAARAVARAFPALAARVGADEIAATVRDALARAADEPRIVVRLSPDDYEPVEERLADLVERAGYPGRLVTLEDAAVAIGDVRVEWADGGLARDLNRIAASVADALGAIAENLSDAAESAAEPTTAAGDLSNV